MVKFFLPVSKVQKDRKIMRVTDSRMAKYSRRGLVFNFVAYLACLAGGRFVDENWNLTLILTGGLLLITLMRGFFLFRFETLYPRAPAKWRNYYFIATLLGAGWWGFILFHVTLKLEMQAEAPLLWLYTVVFFSTTAHAFAPYQKFLAYYQFLGLIPAALAAILTADFSGYLYGVLLLVFYLVLSHQCRLMSESYWEGLEASYALSRKTRSLEEEKKDTRASVKLSNEFLQYLQLDLFSFIEKEDHSSQRGEETVGRLYEQVSDFNQLIAKELYLDNQIFNVRHEVQHIVAEYVDIAEQRDIQIETSLSPTLPMRLRGDANRFAQIIKNLVEMILISPGSSIVMVEVEFVREFEKSGEIYITFSRYFDTQKKLFFNREQIPPIKPNLAFVVSKGLAELMNGAVEIPENNLINGTQIRFTAKMELADVSSRLDFHRNYFAGHDVILIHDNPKVVDVKRHELESLGFNVIAETQYKRALQTLINSYKSQTPIECVLYFMETDNEEIKDFHLQLIDNNDLRHVHQLIAVSTSQQKHLQNAGFVKHDHVHLVDKPTGLFELESAFHEVFGIDFAATGLAPKAVNTDSDTQLDLLMLCHHDNLEGKIRQRLKGLTLEFKAVSVKKEFMDAIQANIPDVILLDFSTEENIKELIGLIRNVEIERAVDGFVPIVALGSSSQINGHPIYELGLDDFVEVSNEYKNFKAIIQYWATLH